MKDKSVAKPTGKLIRKIGQFLVKNWSAFQSGQHVGKMRADLEDYQAKQGVQKVDKNRTERIHQHFTKSSPDLEALSLERFRQCDGKMSAVFNLSFVLLPHIAEYMRKCPIQFDIPSSYLYGVVLQKLCL